MLHNIKELIFKIEYLGIDTQPLRDLLNLLRTNKELMSNYKESLDILDTLASRSSSPELITQVGILLKDLHVKVLNPQQNISSSSSNASSNSNNNSSVLEIMTKLLDIKNDLNQIKSTRGTPGNKEYVNENPSELSIGRVFVNPISSTKVDNIKSNVKIDSQVGEDITSKLDKLKKLKKS